MKKSVLIFFTLLLCSVNAQIQFENQAELVGINQTTGVVSMGGGISFADFDNDGWDDISLGTGNGESIKFYKNYNGFFVQEDLLPTELNFQNKSIIWVDYDNDGDKDLFVASQTDGNRLFKKISDNTFQDVTTEAGFIDENMSTFGVSWADVNNDGCLDVYLSNRIETLEIPNFFYLNNCDGTFTEVTSQVGLSNAPALTFCSGFFDFNNDGWTDLYIANDKLGKNFLFKNNGDGTFQDISLISGTDFKIDAMSVTIDDYNNDGYFDIFMTNTPNNEATSIGSTILLQNNGDETFSNVSSITGAQLNSWSWGASFLDADNDMDLDLYVSCSYDGSNGFPSYAFYQNNNDNSFTELLNAGLDNIAESFASAVGDINNDGLEDIIVINNNDIPFIWKNTSINTNNYLKIKLEGTVSNRDGVGSRIEVISDGVSQFRYTMCGEGYLSQNSSVETFGLNNYSEADVVKVTWPSGVIDIFENVPVNQVFEIVEGSGLSISEFEINDLYFSNPANNTLDITSSHIITAFTIYTSLGLNILDGSAYDASVKINILDLEPGIYFCNIQFASKSSQKIKFIKK